MKRLLTRTFTSLFALLALTGVVLPVDALAHSTISHSLFSASDNSLDPSRISFQEIASGLTQPLFVTNAGDDSGRLFILERAGRIKILKNGGVLPTSFLDIHTLVKSTSSEQGLLALAFHPSYETNGKFYLVYTIPRNGDSDGSNLVLEQFSVSADPDIAASGSGVILRTIDHPTNSNHNGGTLAFGPDGYLYWSVGDGGGGGDPDNHSQDLTSLLGKILRLDVDSATPYIPSSNPFFSNPNSSIRKEIWAYGLRNPWRISFDRLTGDMYIGDVGQSNREEIDFQSAGSTGGENYGWRVMEGTACYDPSSGCNTTGKVLPVTEYDHSIGCSITGGYVYRGTTYPALDGYYFFGDYCSGRLFTLYKDVNSVWVKTQVADLPYSISTFGEDEDGELYLSNYSAGKIYQIQYDDIVLVTSISRADPSPTKSASVHFVVTFSGNVTGVDLSDFSLTTTGVSGVTLSGISGSGSTYTVTVNTGSGDGTIRLDLIDDDSILGPTLIPLGGAVLGNGSFNSGETYTMDYTAPTILSIVRAKANPNSFREVDFRVTFSEAVLGVDPSDFSLSTTNLTGAVITTASGLGDVYIVKVNTGSGDGTIHLDAIDDDTITDGASNPLGDIGINNGNFTSGEDYVIDKPELPAPRLLAPRNNLITKDNTPIEQWSRVQKADHYEIEFALDNAFILDLESHVVSGLSYETAAPFADGKYFWHVRAYDSSNQPGLWSAARNFAIDTFGPDSPIPTSPIDDASLRTPTFRWQNAPTAVLYEFQYDNSTDFLTPIYTKKARNNFRKPPAMAVGTYYWRVRAKDAIGNWGAWSVIFKINIVRP